MPQALLKHREKFFFLFYLLLARGVKRKEHNKNNLNMTGI